ncbi:MAG: hypothetical protein JNJ57_16425 [Saprospiraceae bacterium]|nr:hypothetical protein [Saprospiraceae bacterium]
MILGINYPWYNYDWDFGTPPPGWQTRAAWAETLENDLKVFRRCNIQVVRWFILGSGMLYGSGMQAPHRLGAQWRFDQIPRIDDAILEDFERLLQIFRKHDLQILPVLIDFKWAFPGLDRHSNDDLALKSWFGSEASFESLKNNLTAFPAGLVKGGRIDVLYDAKKRNQFFAQVLEPFLEISRPFSDTIYAWELINEPEWITRGTNGGLPEHMKVPFHRMLAFLRTGMTFIQGYGFPSTVGFARAGTIADWNERAYRYIQSLTKRTLSPEGNYLNLDINQVHYYPQPSDVLAPAAFPNDRPAVLGEFATRIHPEHWPELPADHQHITSRLRFAQTKGYAAAFPWSYRATDQHTEAHKSVVEAGISTFQVAG